MCAVEACNLPIGIPVQASRWYLKVQYESYIQDNNEGIICAVAYLLILRPRVCMPMWLCSVISCCETVSGEGGAAKGAHEIVIFFI